MIPRRGRTEYHPTSLTFLCWLCYGNARAAIYVFILLSLYVSYVHVRRRLCLYVFFYMSFAVGLCPYILALLCICLCTIFVHVYACICLRTSIHLMVLRTRIFCPSIFCLSLCMSVRLSVFVVVFSLLSLLLLLSLSMLSAACVCIIYVRERMHVCVSASWRYIYTYPPLHRCLNRHLEPRAPARRSQWPPPRYHIETLGTKP